MKPIRSAKYSTSPLNSGIALHYHDCHQLLYVAEGCAEFVINGKKEVAQRGSLVIISRLEMHSISVKSEEYKRYELRINPEYAANYNSGHLHSVFINRPDGFKHVINTTDSRFEKLFSDITAEYEASTAFAEEMQNLLLEQLLIGIYRSAPYLFAENDRKTEMVKKVCRIIEGDLKSKLTLSEIAEKSHLNEYYLSHIFKSVTGYSIMGYQMSLRIAAAKRLLTKTEASIGEIIEACGFSDSSNFSRTFKKSTGQSPSEFRKKFKA